MAPEVAITFFEKLAADFFAGTVTEEDIKKEKKRPSAEKRWRAVEVALSTKTKSKKPINKRR